MMYLVNDKQVSMEYYLYVKYNYNWLMESSYNFRNLNVRKLLELESRTKGGI